MLNNKVKKEKIGYNKNESRLRSEFEYKHCAKKHHFKRSICSAFKQACKKYRKKNHFAKVSKYIRINKN